MNIEKEDESLDHKESSSSKSGSTNREVPVFEGVGVALISLFNEDGTLNISATVDHACQLASLGLKAILLSGTSGEFWALSSQDKIALMKAAKAALPAEVALIAGTGYESTAECINLAGAAYVTGLQGVLVLPPQDNSDLLKHYQKIAEAVHEVNILAYHMPLISRNGIPMDMLPKLPIRGIKDSSTEPQRILEVLDTFAGDIFVGADSLISFAGNSGCTGVLVSLANVAPELCIDAFGGDISAQEKLKELERKSLERFPLNLKEMINERFHVPVYLGKP